ncbi:Pentatricopeptide repeat-containing protein [Vitis vinifera]|uniref:Pentatricopeptide repeat-containing protein n=1 Tax=Vitis vinifera TaxID=29760 RepID=A0A438KL12_VITVI|nr:Pentatricopeptide repeat-containing protein [Vitis vinifera]
MVFDEIPVKNTVCANALLSGYGEAKLWVEGLDFVRRMRSLNLNCDHFTLSAMLRSCAGLSAIELGKQVHGSVIRKVSDVEADVFLQSSLIEMYGKCGSVEKAWEVFNLAGFGYKGERKRDVVLWTSMLAVCGRNGHFEKVIELYKEMLREGIRPDGVAFVTIISACGHTGHVKLGIEAGELEKAWKMVNEMTSKENGSYSISMWGALLNACNEFGNVELGKLAAHKALEMDPHNVGIYVLLSNMYAKFSMWDEIEQLRELMKESGLKKDGLHLRPDFRDLEGWYGLYHTFPISNLTPEPDPVFHIPPFPK